MALTQSQSKRFWQLYRQEFVGRGELHPETFKGLNYIINRLIDDPRVPLIEAKAYCLATAKHESTWAGVSFKPVKEGRQKTPGKAKANQDRYWGTGYYGRGYVQVTWKENYLKVGKLLGVGDKFVKEPDLLLDPHWAYEAMVIGMTLGIYRGHKLDDYFKKGKAPNYVGARDIINGDMNLQMPKSTITYGKHIGLFAQKFEHILRETLAVQEPAQPTLFDEGDSTAQDGALAEFDHAPASLGGESDDVVTDVDPAREAPVTDTTSAPVAPEGTAAPKDAAVQGEAVVGGRPSDDIIKIPANISEAQAMAAKVQSYIPTGGNDTTKTWVTRTIGGISVIGIINWIRDPAHLIPIAVCLGVALILLIFWLSTRYATKKHDRVLVADADRQAKEMAERDKQRAHELELKKLEIAQANAERLANPAKYNVVVDVAPSEPVVKEAAS